ncbi:MAG: Secreted protein containing N-terminal Zinc-dependent carboxypeptidase related domain [Candidatus Saccharicenans subterraneus]|uniref:Secreted protein containing N-terminal Zinc-dependent carboxypeptidase related domain n=1 Tax=Candidatus Saccharicenans subterraneus TaxID=2508984 RepID=A0A3E2BLD1_9BACT|nr:MAG: Secreted protein containing N-terminal Zinc-dependent carboxypeptidase related domain [Candidatus Saccharicenans subterraneum]
MNIKSGRKARKFSYGLNIKRRFGLLLLFLSLIVSALSVYPVAAATGQEKITAPEAFFGFQLGADRKIARWDRIVEYFTLLEKESPRIKVINMGPTTMGHPFLLVIISSPENLANLERIKEINRKISDPRQVPPEEIPLLISQGRAIVCQSMSLHADEIGGTQMSPELAYDLLSRNDAETLRILENVVFLLIPSFNPDGQIMVTDWYYKTLGTEYEGTSPPYLYHRYAGHDNNRDGDFLNLQESTYAARILYQEWKPQAYVDHHHMGSYGARLYVPPYCDPIRPYADPLLWRELSWFGGHIAYRLEEAGKTGIINDAMFPGWGHFGWHWITPFHNIVGMLTESASARIASPLFIQPDQLQGESLQFPAYEAQSNFPHPWEGGWWRLRDIVEQQKISAWAVLDLAARHRETLLYNAYLKAARQTERGASEKPRAFLIPAEQHDRLTAVKLVNTLLQSGIEIHRLASELQVNGVIYPAGSFLVSLAQPKRGLIMNLLGRTLYPDNYWTRSRDGNPQRPYDLATHTMAEFMGVRVDPLDDLPEARLELVADSVKVSGQVRAGAAGYRLDGRLNDSFTAVSLLLDNKIQVLRSDLKTEELNPGDFMVAQAPAQVLESIAARTGVDFEPLNSLPAEGTHRVRRLRVGLYQRYYTGNMEEGWTRLLLEKFDLPYVTIMDADIKSGQLAKKIDLLILPADSTAMIMGEGQEPSSRRRANYPPEYRSGLGQDGLDRLKEFINRGGVLVCLGAAGNFAVEKLGLRLRNVVAEADPKEFFCPGSTLKASIDNLNPLAYGLPEKGLVLFFSSPAYEILPGNDSEKYRVVVRYAERELLQSGWLVGEQYLSKKAAMVEAAYGQGQIILIGLRAQHRAQTHGTFKLLFNTFIR